MQTTIHESDPSPLALERRLLLSYLAVLGAVFLIAAVLLRFAVVGIIDRQTAARLDDVARAGLRSVLFVNGGLEIDKAEISNSDLLTRDQGLQWFDSRGRLVGAEGLTPTSEGQQTFNSAAIPILNPRTHQLIGTIRAGERNDQVRAEIRYLDTGLFFGALFAVIGGGVGGLALTRRAVRPVAQSFDRLREFTANASHELRGPLTAIATSADAALRDAERNPGHDRSRFEAIADATQQMSRLTNDLLLLAGADRPLERELFVIDLAAMLDKVAGHYRARFTEAGTALSFAMDRAAIIYGNPDQIERILGNLLDNALRYTPAGGRVSVESRRGEAEILIAVCDSGIGVAPEHVERIFDRFWRADPARSPGGSGLGLAIARALARRHGGDVTMTSRQGVGSTFVASFPVRPVRGT